jgi:hypothetical protein
MKIYIDQSPLGIVSQLVGNFSDKKAEISNVESISSSDEWKKLNPTGEV